MFEKQNIQETVNELKSDAVKGLTDGEAFRRLQQNGRNEMKAARKKTKIQLFLEQLKDPLIYILLIAAVVSVFLGELSDAVIIGTVVMVIYYHVPIAHRSKAWLSLSGQRGTDVLLRSII